MRYALKLHPSGSHVLFHEKCDSAWLANPALVTEACSQVRTSCDGPFARNAPNLSSGRDGWTRCRIIASSVI